MCRGNTSGVRASTVAPLPPHPPDRPEALRRCVKLFELPQACRAWVIRAWVERGIQQGGMRQGQRDGGDSAEGTGGREGACCAGDVCGCKCSSAVRGGDKGCMQQ